ncbi:ABC transporter B family member 26, chloroplastic-like [Rhododendron vialii]|uniref:ABC transporter B family member 26, chloroplastic-like n=1 Tax=Rhododendron vialii TaxID=182163 RepID=UPI00265F1E64|nr:ABC transporter B family member 26, chloroplastic-like [Rhododendron vialii]
MKPTVPPFNLHNQNHIRYDHAKPLNIHSQFTSKTKLLPPNLIGYKRFRVENSAVGGKQTRARHLLPGGRWWNLSGGSDEVENTTEAEAKPVTVLIALRRIWALVGEEKWIAYAAVASLTLAALSEISIPNILAASVFSAQSGETVVFCRNSQLLLFLCLTSGICSGVRSGCFGIANMILLKRLRESFFTALIYQDISFFDSEAVGGLTSRLGADCQRLSHVLGNDIHLILRNALQGIGALINLLTLSWPLALSTLVICSLLSTIFLVYGQYQKKAAKFTQEYSARANEVAQETFSLMRTVRVYGTEDEELKRYKQWLDKIVFIGIREGLAYGFWHLSFSTLYRSTQVVAVLLGGMSILTGHVTAEQLMKYVLYCEWLIYAAWRVEDNLSSLLQTVGATENVFQLMNLMPSDQFLSKGMKLQRLMGKIEFVNVSFYYPSRLTVPVLEHLNISVRAKEMIAIVGLSGSGKSTLVNLLLRLYEPTNGEILVDGFPLRKLDIRWLRDKIGFVGQEPHLLHMDVKSNICYGCSRDIIQEDIEWAAEQAHAHEFISSLPSGYETIVDDCVLSGGQKQRIAIARAIIRDPTILILDEATSALDADNEYYISRVLHAFRNDGRARRTIIVIAHSLSTVKAADRIMVMNSGRVVEMGNHAELLHMDGLYARLVKTKTDALG